MNEIYEFMKQAGVFYIATIDGDQPRVRPFGAIHEFEGRIYIVTSNEKPVFKQMMANPKIEVSAMTQDGRWLRLTTQVAVDDRREARKAMLDANENLRAMYSEDDGKCEVLYFSNSEASICSFTAAPVLYKF